MLDQPETGVPQLLHDLNADQALIKQRLDEVLNGFPQATGDGPGDGQAYITPHVKQVLDLASQEASRHQDELISNRHMLFAILSERDTAVARLLSEAGITSDGLAGVGNLPPGGQ
jgi:ATP-dependent Clp protease ATP-binding subunit ClpA